MKTRPSIPSLLAAAIIASLGACSGDGNSAGGNGTTGAGTTTSGAASGGGVLQPFTAPGDPGPGGILFTASGVALAQIGYHFPPAHPDDAHLVDGWNIEFDRLLVTIDKIVLSDNPDLMPGDQSKTGGVIAEVDGPWAVDLHHVDPSYPDGKSGSPERAIPIAALTSQGTGTSFEPGTRYAFGFDAIPATDRAKNVNLDDAAIADYQQMRDQGCVVLYAGTATFKGDKTDPNCYPDDGHRSWPDRIAFKLCFRSPTTYVNCQNPDNTGTPFADEESQRGIAFQSNNRVVAQITFHTDHPFWDSVLHDSPPHFDQFAARVVGRDGGAPTVILEDTQGVDYTSYTDSLGNIIDWRYCTDPPTDVHPKFVGPMSFDPQGVPHASGTDARSGLRDYYDFTTYNQSTQGHLNADGLCFIERHYDSPQ